MSGIAILICVLVTLTVCFFILNATIAGDLAREKSRNVLVWTLLALMFGPLATFLLYVAPAKRIDLHTLK